MWEISLGGQITAFVLSIAIGFIYRVIYDVVLSAREAFKAKKTAEIISDIIYFIAVGFFEFCFFLVTCLGEIRVFVFIGNLAGFLIAKVSVSKILRRVLTFLFMSVGKGLNLIKSAFSFAVTKNLRKLWAFFKKIPLKQAFFKKKVLKNDDKIVYTKENIC